MNEARILQDIRLGLGMEPGLRLFRNNVGLLRDDRGQPVRFGLHPGSADLIGWRSVTVTSDMLGRRLALFLSIEVKDATGKPRPDQIQWAAAVTAAGGLAGVARSPDQARIIAGLVP